MSKDKIYLSWQDIENQLDRISNKLITDNFIPDYIIAISRGGLVPGVILSHRLLVIRQNFLTWNIYSYTTENKQEIIKADTFNNFSLVENKKVLVVDDIIDSGKTIKYIKGLFNLWSSSSDIRFAVLVNKLPTYFISDIVTGSYKELDNKWIVFPWENNKNE